MKPAKVEFRFKNGRIALMNERQANILQYVGRGTYVTRDAAIELASAVPVPRKILEEIAEASKNAAPVIFPDGVAGEALDPESHDTPNVSEKQDSECEESDGDALDRMSVDELREMASQMGLKVHHRAGPDKLREAIREARGG